MWGDWVHLRQQEGPPSQECAPVSPQYASNQWKGEWLVVWVPLEQSFAGKLLQGCKIWNISVKRAKDELVGGRA